MKKSKFTSFIEKKLKEKSTVKRKKGGLTNEYFIKGKKKSNELCKMKFLNITMPELHCFLIELVSEVQPTYKEIKDLWFQTDIFEARTLAAYWLEQQGIELQTKKYADILSWINVIDNWAHADIMCSIYARLFEKMPKKILPFYLKWNRHKNSWFRRCSMVGLFYYSRQRKKVPAFLLAKKMVIPHISAKEYYVQKAVGWTIREAYNVYPSETTKFIEDNISEISSVAWYAATEKMSNEMKKNLMNKRRQIKS